MKEEKDILELFRENEHKLRENPSSEAWTKLEQRLERQRGRRRISPLRNYLLAASVVGLLVVVTLLGGILDVNSEGKVPRAQARQLEDLVAEVDPSTTEQLIEFQRSYQEKVREQPVPEGSEEKKLVVRP